MSNSFQIGSTEIMPTRFILNQRSHILSDSTTSKDQLTLQDHTDQTDKNDLPNMVHYPSLKDLPKTCQPRERLLNDGVHTLDPIALLSLILGTGNGQYEDAYQMAQRMLHMCGGIQGLFQSDLKSLCSIDGIGPVKACRLLAAFEFSKRALYSLNKNSSMKLDYRSKLARIARDLWVEDTHMLLAYPHPMIQETRTLALDHALTLDLNLTPYLRQLLMAQSELSLSKDQILRSLSTENQTAISPNKEVFQTWVIFILHACEVPQKEEMIVAKKLYDKAQLLEVPIETIMMVSETQDWILLSTHKTLNQEVYIK
jgi:hypothetical protein